MAKDENKKKASRRRLGKGLDELIQDRKMVSAVTVGGVKTQGIYRQVAVNSISPNPWQPRRTFDAESLKGLTESIRHDGLLQPVILRQTEKNRYQLIAGERRWRAASVAALETIPAVVLEVDDRDAAVFALVENVQREDLNPIEKAASLQTLVDNQMLTHKEIGTRIGLTRSAVSNLIRLLALPEAVQEMVRQNRLAMGNARALLALPTVPMQQAAAERACNQTVRQTEQMVANILENEENRQQSRRKTDPDIARLARELSDRIGARVAIDHRSTGRGTLRINYGSAEELSGILERLGFNRQEGVEPEKTAVSPKT